MSALAIIELQGKDACAFANYVCTNQMDIKRRGASLTRLLCTPKGGIKRDMAAARLAEDRYWLFTGNGTLPQELDWLQKPSGDFDISINDLSQSYVALGLFGPNARKVLEKVTPNDVSNEAFPFYTWQTVEIGLHRVYAMRLSYVGELGWEFHLPADVALSVYDELMAAGQDLGIVPVGVGAMRSMRVEKGYKLWGADMHTEHNPYEAGMAWMVKLKKGDFVGRDALVGLKEEGSSRNLVTLTIDDPNAVLMGNEPIFAESKVVGRITSGNYGYCVGKYIAFGYVPTEFSDKGQGLEVEYLTQRYPAVVADDVLFDPENVRMKG